ncbi:MAG TPA: recombinase XerD [Mycobacterium sp.]|nr:recombinase XerD [Mycobacterium sp.]
MLPGLAIDGDRRPICLSCAGIPGDFTCRCCGAEGDFYRRGTCARCALRADLTAAMIDGAHDPQAMAAIVDALCRVDRPASILTWKRSPRVQELLIGLASGEISLTHQGRDKAGTDIATNHLRSMLEHAGIVAARDEPLARFERWLFQKLEAVTEPAVRAPVEQFARWHHLRRLRKASVPGQSSAAGSRYAKQEITEAIKFLTWLHSAHSRTLATCLQQDVDEWLASGPATRLKVRNLLAWAKKTRLNKSVQITHQQAPPSRALTQQQRLAWLRELVDGDSESLAYRVAGILLLLFGQPLTRIAALPTSAITFTENDVRISLGQEPIPVPQPFADMLGNHMASRPNLGTTGGVAATPWLFPSSRPGRHLGPQFIMTRLCNLGINLLGARNTALQSLVVEAPPPLVAELLGYSYHTAQRHAEIAAQPWARYVTKTAAEHATSELT